MDPTKTRAIVDELHRALAARDLDAVRALYAEAAELVRYDGAANGRDQIGSFYGRYLDNHGAYDLRSIDQFRSEDDVVLWDASVDTDEGVLLTFDVAIVDDAGLIVRHVPTVRGYWGQ